MEAKTTLTVTRCGRPKRSAAEVDTIGRCEKRSKNDLPDEIILATEDHSHLTDEVILGTEDHPHLPVEVISATEDHPHLPDEVNLATEDHPHLPDEVIFENIMTKVPVSTLKRCGCISKHWYKSILHDPHFAITYLAQQPKNDPPFVFIVLNNLINASKLQILNFIICLEKDDDYDREEGKKTQYNALFFREKYVLGSELTRIKELVGNCNGLICLSQSPGNILIVNPSREEFLSIFNPPIINKDSGCIICCYGFGFDSLAHEYKVVLIAAVKKSEFKCLVFTLGTNSWRETSTTIPLPVTTTSFYKSAIFCSSGALFWRTKTSSSDNNMLLLSFDLHDDELQVIRLPAECASSSLLEPEHQIIDPLLEFKGSPCVARLEKTILGGGGGGGGGSCTSTSSDDQNTSYCYKVHLHILKEYSKVGRPNEQVWIKETFDVAPSSYTACLSPAAPCFLGHPNSTFIAPPNRIMSSSDGQIFLYCFRGGQVFEAYDLQTKWSYIAGSDRRYVFRRKSQSDVHYHLNGCHIENFMSMLAFVPKRGGAPPRLNSDELNSILNDKQKTLPVVGYLTVQPGESTYHYLL